MFTKEKKKTDLMTALEVLEAEMQIFGVPWPSSQVQLVCLWPMRDYASKQRYTASIEWHSKLTSDLCTHTHG